MNKPKPSNDWEEIPAATTRPKRGVLVNVDGLEGMGKSSLALTMAKLGMIAYVDIDQSIDRAQRPVVKKGRKFEAKLIPIRYKASLSEAENKAQCGPAWNKIRTGGLEASEKWAKTVIVDTADEAWEILRLGAFGTVTPKGRTDSLYGPVNASYRQWLRTMHRHNMAHVILVNKMKEIWKKGADGQSSRTGKFERVGFKELGYLADMSLTAFVDDRGKFMVRIDMCKLAPNGPSLQGTEYEVEDMDLPAILCMATDTELEEWTT